MKSLTDLLQISDLSDDELWLIVADEASDPILASVTRNQAVSQSAILITNKQVKIVINEMEAGNLKIPTSSSAVDVMVYEGDLSYSDLLSQAIKSMGDARKILMNYSAEPECDFLTHGLYLKTMKWIEGIESNISVSSADHLIKRFYERKTDAECDRISLACRRAIEIIEEAFLLTKVGDTELDIHHRFHSIAQQKPGWFEDNEIVGQSYAWEKSLCPIVLAGENLQKGAHSAPSHHAVKQGDTLYCDFGVKLTFADGETWASDLQRMAVVVGDDAAMKRAEEVFGALYSSVSKAAALMKPNVPISDIDRAAREEIMSHGYPDYVHATGHAIGNEAHGIGETIRPNEEGCLAQGGTYTIEPRVKIPNGGSIEEIVRVTENGGEFLSDRQDRLLIIEA